MRGTTWVLSLLLCGAAWAAKGQDGNQLTIRPGDRVADSTFQYILEKSGRASDPPALFILDFWSTSCTSCIAAFPKVDSLQKQFAGSVQFLLINSQENQDKVYRHFELMNARRQKRGNQPINLPKTPSVAGEDYLRNVFPHMAVPHHVWISNTGYVVAITNGGSSNASTIQGYLDGRRSDIEVKKDFTNMDTDHPLFLSKDVDRSQIEHFSLLIKGHAGYFRHPRLLDSTRHFAMNKPLRNLYESLASRLVPLLRHGRLIIEGNISALDDQTYYTYDFIVPRELSDSLYRYALADLNRYVPVFGRVEKRRLPAFILTFSEGKSVFESKGGARKNTLYLRDNVTHERQVLINQEWEDHFLPWVSSTVRKSESTKILVDETGISGNIDIEFDDVVNDYHSLRLALRRYGISILEAEREVEVFVLSAKKMN
ncbi:MAG TPA: hypothetical protein VNQ55_00315 [Parapedobacter sp.]|nr:hypothetical protein [Parapedobacter sp.]